MRIHLIDGPHHGTTMYRENQPEDFLIMPGIIALDLTWGKELTEEKKQVFFTSHHKYRRLFNSKFNTEVYVYEGQT